MELKDWLLPIVSIALGIGSLFIDNKQSKRLTYVLLAMLVASGLITVLVNAADTRKTEAEHVGDQKRIDKLIDGNNMLLAGNQQIKLTSETILNGLKASGIVKSVVDVVATSLQAGPARNKILADVRAESTPRPRVIYFPKDVDIPTVIRC